MKTADEIVTDVMGFLEGTALVGGLSGRVYRDGYRPRDSRKEDLVVIHTSGLAGQTQTGVVTLQVWVPDMDSNRNGVLEKDGRRCGELEGAVRDWVEGLTTARTPGYRFRVQQTITTEEDREVGQHFVVLRMNYEFNNEEA